MFIYANYYNIKNCVKTKVENRLKIEKNKQNKARKLQKTFVAVFAEYEFYLTTRQNLKKTAGIHKRPGKTAKNRKNLK